MILLHLMLICSVKYLNCHLFPKTIEIIHEHMKILVDYTPGK